jgi:predicted nucleic acid-binding protein
MSVALDTSVILRLLTGEPEALAGRALVEVQELPRGGEALVVSDLVVSEVYFALQYHYDMPNGRQSIGMKTCGRRGQIRSFDLR